MQQIVNVVMSKARVNVMLVNVMTYSTAILLSRHAPVSIPCSVLFKVSGNLLVGTIRYNLSKQRLIHPPNYIDWNMWRQATKCIRFNSIRIMHPALHSCLA